MAKLLTKTRKINRVLQKAKVVEYDSISRVLSNVIDANVFVVNNVGKVYGYAFVDEFEEDKLIDQIVSQSELPKHYVNWLLDIHSTLSNIDSEDNCALEPGAKCTEVDKLTTVVPIFAVGERMGTLIVTKFGSEFDDDDLLLAEYGATVIGMEILRDNSQKMEMEIRKKATVQIALETLSYSEIEAAVNILGELNGNEGLLVASKVADRVGITRSVIVNALRKFESAGIIESKSLGMKGTYIKIKNEYLLDEIHKIRS